MASYYELHPLQRKLQGGRGENERNIEGNSVWKAARTVRSKTTHRAESLSHKYRAQLNHPVLDVPLCPKNVECKIRGRWRERGKEFRKDLAGARNFFPSAVILRLDQQVLDEESVIEI
ncbi:hypothetical protein KM043_006548 [Ampulex compressa]|nr:hypothetical protein KM043_006548 [Ampulex compressa]